MKACGLMLFCWAGFATAADVPPDVMEDRADPAPAQVQLEALPDAPREIPAEDLPESPPVPDAARIDRFALEGPRFLKDSTRIALKDLRALGAVRSEQVKKAANVHDPLKVDEFRTLTFDGLELYGYLGDQQELWPIRIVVSSADWEIAEGLGVGAAVARLQEVLGEPPARNAGVWAYPGEIQNVNFTVRDDKIEKIEFIYYLD